MTRVLLILVLACQLLIAPITGSVMHASMNAMSVAHAEQTPHAAETNHQHLAAQADPAAQHIDHRCCEPGGHCSPGLVQLAMMRTTVPRLSRAPEAPRVALLPRGISLTPYRPPSHSV